MMRVYCASMRLQLELAGRQRYLSYIHVYVRPGDMILWRTVFCLLVATSSIFSPILSMVARMTIGSLRRARLSVC